MAHLRNFLLAIPLIFSAAHKEVAAQETPSIDNPELVEQLRANLRSFRGPDGNLNEDLYNEAVRCFRDALPEADPDRTPRVVRRQRHTTQNLTYSNMIGYHNREDGYGVNIGIHILLDGTLKFEYHISTRDGERGSNSTSMIMSLFPNGDILYRLVDIFVDANLSKDLVYLGDTKFTMRGDSYISGPTHVGPNPPSAEAVRARFEELRQARSCLINYQF